MFSASNSALVIYSDGIFTRYSATSANHTNDGLQNDLIAFLSIAQKCNVDFLPITWQPALGNLGEGGSGTISQSTFNADMSLAFKQFHYSRDSEMNFLPLMSEVLILSQPPIQNHPNIINLEGICWEIKPHTEKAIPVLVFEKAAWDLHQFMNVPESMNMSIEERLKICADIGIAIMALHDYGLLLQIIFAFWKSDIDTGVIHGDIKPHNVLVFKDATTGKTSIKVADFGYSTLVAGEASAMGEEPTVAEVKIFLPKSRPWNAPEHHFGEFTATEAKKTDVYSFGMLCLWVLFGSLRIPPISTEYTFDGATGPLTSLEVLKYDDKMEHFVSQFLESMPGLNVECRKCLAEFFSITVPLNPEERTSDLRRLIRLLSQEQ
jgi:serine/threonine protein kinase